MNWKMRLEHFFEYKAYIVLINGKHWSPKVKVLPYFMVYMAFRS
jgi:hypothetical protein